VSSRVFLDTTVLVYADDADAGDKNRTAQDILAEAMSNRTGVISNQVLQEYFITATRRLGVAPETARRKIELLGTLDIVRIQLTHILEAIDTTRLYSISFWDALIVRCAVFAGCSRLLTESLQHDQVIAGICVENPFRPVN
jgi:predicted nucleic acid-binding protein